MTQYVGHYNYWVVIFLMMTGFYIVIARSNLIQKVIGLNIFQISVFLLYITMGKVTGGTAPILPYHHEPHAAAVSHESHAASHDEAAVQTGDPDSHTSHDEASDGSQDVPQDTSHHGASESTPADGTSEAAGEHGSGGDGHGGQDPEGVVYTHPLPSVLMLTAIVVGVATTALALALVIRIGEAYGTIEEDEILQRDREDA